MPIILITVKNHPKTVLDNSNARQRTGAKEPIEAMPKHADPILHYWPSHTHTVYHPQLPKSDYKAKPNAATIPAARAEVPNSLARASAVAAAVEVAEVADATVTDALPLPVEDGAVVAEGALEEVERSLAVLLPHTTERQAV